MSVSKLTVCQNIQIGAAVACFWVFGALHAAPLLGSDPRHSDVNVPLWKDHDLSKSYDYGKMKIPGHWNDDTNINHDKLAEHGFLQVGTYDKGKVDEYGEKVLEKDKKEFADASVANPKYVFVWSDEDTDGHWHLIKWDGSKWQEARSSEQISGVYGKSWNRTVGQIVKGVKSVGDYAGDWNERKNDALEKLGDKVLAGTGGFLGVAAAAGAAPAVVKGIKKRNENKRYEKNQLAAAIHAQSAPDSKSEDHGVAEEE